MLPFSRSAGQAPAAARSLGLRHLIFFGIVVALLGAVLHLMPRAAPAETAPQPDVHAEAAAPTLSETDSGVRLGGGYLGALALLLGGAALALYLRRTAQPEGAALMRTLGSFKLAPNQQLRLVACGEDVLLLGVTASTVTLLKTYPRAAFVASEADVRVDANERLSSEKPNLPRDAFATALRERAVRSAMPPHHKSRTSGETETVGSLC